MPYGNEMQNSMNPSRNISEILMDIDKILCWHKSFNDKAMKACQAANFQGFKRLHRVNVRCFLNYHLKIENEANDKFRFVLETDYEDVKYSVSSLVEHLKNWDIKLGQDIEKLAMLNNEYRKIAGTGNKIVKKALKKMNKNHEKTGRWYNRFSDTKSMHDIYDFDSKLHAKMKAKEERK